MNQFSLVQAVNGFSQRVVIAVASAANGRLDPGVGQMLAVPDRHILRTPVAAVNQHIGTFRSPVVQSLVQRVQHEVRSHGTALTPAHNPARIDINHNGHILPALPG